MKPLGDNNGHLDFHVDLDGPEEFELDNKAVEVMFEEARDASR